MGYKKQCLHHATRSGALMDKEGGLRNHEGPLYKVHTSCTMLSHREGKLSRHCQRPKDMAP